MAAIGPARPSPCSMAVLTVVQAPAVHGVVGAVRRRPTRASGSDTPARTIELSVRQKRSRMAPRTRSPRTGILRIWLIAEVPALLGPRPERPPAPTSTTKPPASTNQYCETRWVIPSSMRVASGSLAWSCAKNFWKRGRTKVASTATVTIDIKKTHAG